MNTHPADPLALLGVSAEPLALVSWWKAILVLACLLAWGWVVATIYDKDAPRWNFKRHVWNLFHLGAAACALAAALFAPTFLVGFPVLVALLAGDLLVYFMHHNRSDEVPDRHKWRLSLEGIRQRLAARRQKELERGVTLTFRGPKGVTAPPERGTPEYDVRIRTESMLIDAISARASRIDIAPDQGGQYAIALMIDGVRRSADPMPAPEALAVIDFIKSSAGLDVADRRRKLRADLAIEQSGIRRVLRALSSGASGGVRLSVIIDPEKQVAFTKEKLGLLPSQAAELQKIVQDETGIVLVAAPPASGRTSTLYAMVRAHDAYTKNIQTIETEPGGALEGVRQNVFDHKKEGAEYATTLRSILRRDPDLVFVAELPDVATAKEILGADQERTRTYVSVRADNALLAVQTFMKAVEDPRKCGAALKGVIAQRLVRRLCSNCRVEYAPTPEMIKRLNVPVEKVKSLFKKGGQVLIKGKPEVCPVCQGAGYFGQEGAFEVFHFGPDEQGAIAQGDLIALRNALRRKRLPSIQEAAVQKALSGLTSVEEIARLAGAPKQQTQAPAPGAGGDAPAKAGAPS